MKLYCRFRYILWVIIGGFYLCLILVLILGYCVCMCSLMNYLLIFCYVWKKLILALFGGYLS